MRLRMRTGLGVLLSVVGIVSPHPTGAQNQPNSAQPRSPFSELNRVYQDESHCLTAPESRGDKDSPASCYCRDAIVDARYVWHTYLITGKDHNLNGAELRLQI